VRKTTRIASFAIVGSLLGVFPAPATAQTARTPSGESQPVEEGPVATIPGSIGQPSSPTPSDPSGYVSATESAAGARAGGGAPLGAYVGGALESAREQADRRIKRLIKRLG